MKRVGSLQAGDAGIRHSRIVYPIWRLDNTALQAVRRLSLITTLPRRILPMMSSRGALAVALFVAVVTQGAGICQLRCVTIGGQSPVMHNGGQSPSAPARHACHASDLRTHTTSPSLRLDEGCQHLSGVTAVLATPPRRVSRVGGSLGHSHRPSRFVAARFVREPRTRAVRPSHQLRRHAPHLVTSRSN